MHTEFINQPIDYDGSQLHSGFVRENTGISGEGIAAFRGRCDVSFEHMVDLEDLEAHLSIYSEDMLHFIAEFMETDLEKAVLRQRLLMAIVREQLEKASPGILILRDGDDLFIEERKLSVSIATTSSTSSLIHAGLNVSSRNTPVPAIGLDDLGIGARDFALRVLSAFSAETDSIRHATTKVRSVA